ncbi:MAG TPA: NusA-like transcription termination signal-binding factor [archaeon]|nr:NusA-like transcription termination signal-binding factor [archaeon]
MKLKLDTNAIQSISIMQSIIGSDILDFIDTDDIIYIIVGEGKYGFVVGKNGVKIKFAEKKFKKSIKVLEYSPDMEKFIKNMVPEAKNISINEKNIIINIKNGSRARIIGKSGKNVKIMGKILNRLFDVESFSVK